MIIAFCQKTVVRSNVSDGVFLMQSACRQPPARHFAEAALAAKSSGSPSKNTQSTIKRTDIASYIGEKER